MVFWCSLVNLANAKNGLRKGEGKGHFFFIVLCTQRISIEDASVIVIPETSTTKNNKTKSIFHVFFFIVVLPHRCHWPLQLERWFSEDSDSDHCKRAFVCKRTSQHACTSHTRIYTCCTNIYVTHDHFFFWMMTFDSNHHHHCRSSGAWPGQAMAANS